MLVTAEAQSVHEAEGHGVGTPVETALGRVELWGNVGGNASVNEVLKNFESARRERNGAVRIKRSGVTISLDDRNDKAGRPCGRNHRKPWHKVEERKQKMTPPRERDFEERVWQAVRAWCRLVALGECSNEFVVRKGRIISCRFVQGRERREAERNRAEKIRLKTKSPQWGRKNVRAKGNVPRQEGGQSKRGHATAHGKVQE